jgi:hypothetical protein
MISAKSSSAHPARHGGFSVLELLVSAGLLVVIMLGLLAMFYQTERAFRIGIAQTDILEGGRAAMELIVNDVREMRAAADVQHWPHSPSQPPHVDITNFAVLSGYPGVWQTLDPANSRENRLQSFYFLTRENNSWRGVRYDFDPAQADGGAGTLYRMDLIPGLMPPVLVNDPETISSQLSVNDYAATLGANYGRIVDGVVHLSVRAYDELGNLSTNTFPYPDPGPFYHYAYTNRFLPAYVEVELGILEPKAVERYRGMTNLINMQTNYVAGQAKRVHLFRQRVPIRSTPVIAPLF